MNTFEGLKSLFLNLTGSNDTFADNGRGFPRLHFREFSKGYGLYLAMNIDAVEQWTGNPVEVTLYLTWGADAVVCGISIVTARTGVHGGYHHKRTRVFDGVTGAADCDTTVFKGLA
jgi:hypothetical protein